VTAAFDLLSGFSLEDGRRWGEAATEVQRADAAAVLDSDSTARYHWISRSRGFSKTFDLAGCALAMLLVQAPSGSRSYAAAADQAQAALLIDTVEGITRRSPVLAEHVSVQSWKVTATRTGATLEALAADAASSWGLRPFLVVCDELTQWGETRGPKRLWESLSSAVPKTGGRLVCISTAGDPSHWSAKVRAHASSDPLWRCSEVEGPPPWMDAALVAEQRRRLPESSFQRLYENRWASGEDRLVDEQDLVAAVVLDGPQQRKPGVKYCVGLDVGLKRDATAAAVCHLENGTAFLDRMGVWHGSWRYPVDLDEVEHWLALVAGEYQAEIVFDPHQAAQLTQRLRKRGIRVREYTFTPASIGAFTSTLFQLLRDRALRLPADDDLLDEIRSVRMRETSPNVYRIDHDPGRHDDRVIALALALHRLVERGERRPTVIRSFNPNDLGPLPRSPWLRDPLDDLFADAVYDRLGVR
jgi:phage terminase large subunit-like protein